MRLGARVLLPDTTQRDRASRFVRPSILSLLRGGGSLPHCAECRMEGNLFSLHASGPHRWRECTDGKRTIKERSPNIGPTARKRASLFSQTFWISRPFTRGVAFGP